MQQLKESNVDVCIPWDDEGQSIRWFTTTWKSNLFACFRRMSLYFRMVGYIKNLLLQPFKVKCNIIEIMPVCIIKWYDNSLFETTKKELLTLSDFNRFKKNTHCGLQIFWAVFLHQRCTLDIFQKWMESPPYLKKNYFSTQVT